MQNVVVEVIALEARYSTYAAQPDSARLDNRPAEAAVRQNDPANT